MALDMSKRITIKETGNNGGMSKHEPCIVCGADLKPGHDWVAYDFCSGSAIPADVYAEKSDDDDWGLVGIGSGCLRSNPELKAALIK